MGSPIKILAIVGSKEADWDEETIPYVKGIIEWTILDEDPDVVVSGACPKGGVDIWAIEIAEKMGYTTVEFPPENNRWQPAGYKDRNIRIAKACTELLRIKSRRSRTNGSGWTADRAAEMGKHVETMEI